MPLWWDRGTLEDLLRWKQERQATDTEPFLVSFLPGRGTLAFSRHTLRKRFRTACKVLGADRQPRSPFTTVATRSSVTPWPAGGQWQKFATRQDMPT